MYSGGGPAASETLFEAVGTGQTVDTGSVDLANVLLGGTERAAFFEAVAFSDQGEIRKASGIGYFVPEQGWTLRAVGEGCSLSAPNFASVTFAVTGESGTSNWAGHVKVTLTQNYAP